MSETSALSKIAEVIPPEAVELHIAVKQTEALTVLADGLRNIATFLNGGGLAEVLDCYSKSQAAKEILGGLASNLGRGALDARTVKQNALEITEMVEAVYAKVTERLSSVDKRDPAIVVPETGEEK
jgi:hypothetical protein